MKRFLLILLFLLGVTGVSNATTITYNTQLDIGGVLTTTLSGAIVEDFNSGSVSWDHSGDGLVVTGTTGQYAAPYNNTLMAGSDSSKYLSVPNPKSSGSFEFTFSTYYNYFGLFWGSIDDYNMISFYDNAIFIESWAGDDLPFPSVANGNQSSDTSNLYVNFYGVNSGLGFNRVILTSTQFAFEVDNLAVANLIPEPAIAILLGIGLMGLAAVGRKKIFKK